MTLQSIGKDDFDGRRLVKGMTLVKVRVLRGERFQVPNSTVRPQGVFGPCLK
jgi:hypothetical protein